jgi:hypothetical protein
MRLRTRKLVVAVVVVGALCACDGGTEATTPSPSGGPVPIGPGDGILFVGNSLTYANDLPGMVEGLASAAGVKLQTAQVAYPNYSLADHLRQGDAPRSIATGGWRVVVLQQGPSGQPESRDLLRKDTATFDVRIRAVGARTALFAVWADSQGPSSFDEVRESYSLAAADVGAIYLPVNEAWTLAWDRQRTLRLYSSDGFHPSEEGTYLAALVMVGVLGNTSAQSLPASFMRPTGRGVSIPEAEAAVLREAAAAAIAAYARR